MVVVGVGEDLPIPSIVHATVWLSLTCEIMNYEAKDFLLILLSSLPHCILSLSLFF
jgi:hypothetical protein